MKKYNLWVNDYRGVERKFIIETDDIVRFIGILFLTYHITDVHFKEIKEKKGENHEKKA